MSQDALQTVPAFSLAKASRYGPFFTSFSKDFRNSCSTRASVSVNAVDTAIILESCHDLLQDPEIEYPGTGTSFVFHPLTVKKV